MTTAEINRMEMLKLLPLARSSIRQFQSVISQISSRSNDRSTMHERGLQTNTIESLDAWNEADAQSAVREALPCCGSHAWAIALAAARPFPSMQDVLDTSDAIWLQLGPVDWDEAFSTHPRIGEMASTANATMQSAKWSNEEQATVGNVDAEILARLAHGNSVYEQLFGRTYIVCATGKSPEQMLAILETRLQNDKHQELQEAVEQQRQITQIRLKKWLNP